MKGVVGFVWDWAVYKWNERTNEQTDKQINGVVEAGANGLPKISVSLKIRLRYP